VPAFEFVKWRAIYGSEWPLGLDNSGKATQELRGHLPYVEIRNLESPKRIPGTYYVRKRLRPLQADARSSTMCT
jgi:hypothetical protein